MHKEQVNLIILLHLKILQYKVQITYIRVTYSGLRKYLTTCSLRSYGPDQIPSYLTVTVL